MDIYDLLRVLPLASAATWFVLAGLQVYRDRIHTWTETFFLLLCLFAAFYATWDFLFFTAGSIDFAKFAGLMSTSSAIVTSLFLLLFTVVYIDRMRRVYWSFGVVAIAVLVVLWFFGLEGVVQVGSLWIPVYNEVVFLVIIAYIGSYSHRCLLNRRPPPQNLRMGNPPLGGGTRGLLVGGAPARVRCPAAQTARGRPPP